MPVGVEVYTSLAIKAGYILGALLMLWGLRCFITRPAINNDYKKSWRFFYFFNGISFLLFVGYVATVLHWPGWIYLSQSLGLLPSLLVDDSFSILLLIGYFLCFMRQSYLMQRQAGSLSNGFGSYMMQYGYRGLFILNILLFLRIDNNYLPVLTEHLSTFCRTFVEGVTLGLFLLLQIGVLYVRQLMMVEAGPELQTIVADVAACFGIKIKKVRIWKLGRLRNAFSTGLFRREVFLTAALVESVSSDDLKMILAHECAHFKRRHLELRVMVIAILVYLGSTLMDEHPLLNWSLHTALALAAFLVYQALARRQELQADRLAGRIMGGNQKMAVALVNVLGGTTMPSKFGRLIGLLLGHPDLETRLKCLQR